MKPYRLKVRILITISGIISIFVFAIVLLIWHKADTNKLSEMLIHYGLIILPITFLWWLLEKYAWHWSSMQKIRSALNIPPDLRGRWEGYFKRENEDDSHEFAIEIKQTLSKIWVHTYSRRSASQSHLAEIATDDSEEEFTICFLWLGDGGEIPHRGILKGKFNGYSMLKLYEKEAPKKLSGEYFTNRDPQTKGEIALNWVSLQFKRKY